MDPIRVLYLDDDPDQWVIVRNLLQADSSTLQLLHASDLRTLCDGLASGGVQVVLADYRMGAHTGLQLLQQAGVDPELVPVVFLTELEDPAIVLEVLRAGAVDYLTKANLTRDRLRDAIRYALSRQDARQMLRTTRRTLFAILDHVPQAIFWKDEHGSIQGGNSRFARWAGIEDTIHLQGQKANDLPLSDGQRHFLAMFQPSAEPFRERNFQVVDQKGRTTNLEASAVRLDLPAGASILGTFSDITSRLEAEQARLQAETSYRNIFEHATEGIYRTDLQGHLETANPSLAHILGYETPTEMIAAVKDVRKLYVQPGTRDRFIAACQIGALQDFESEVYRKDGSIVWVSENARPILDQDGACLGFEGSVTDITRRKENEESLFRLAYFHPLTHLPNRSKLIKDLEEILLPQGPAFTLLVLNLDRFKLINDSLGPMYGDQMIQETARRLLLAIPPDCPAYSMGGDEFAVILKRITDDASLQSVTENIQTLLARPLRLGKREVITSVSIGSVRSTIGYRSPEQLLRAADTAMARAKDAGGAVHFNFQFAMYQKVLTRLEMEDELRKALDNGEFVVYYQPIIALQPRRAVGCEALVRWVHPEKGFISPAEFIPVTEETGLIVALGEWIMREALRQLHEWHQQGFPEFYTAINVSVQQFQTGRLSEMVRAGLEDSKVDPSSLKVEITESIAMKNVDYTVSTFRELEQMGVRISIDDFGTGFSSLAYLKEFRFHTLKIDRTFVSDLSAEEGDSLLVHTIAELARNLNLDVVAEGVETEEQLKILEKLGIPNYQGFFFGKPLPAKDFLPWLRKFNSTE